MLHQFPRSPQSCNSVTDPPHIPSDGYLVFGLFIVSLKINAANKKGERNIR